jgi:hypothetical protein
MIRSDVRTRPLFSHPAKGVHPIASRSRDYGACRLEKRVLAVLINVTYDPSVSGAPAAFKNAVSSVVQYFDSQFSDSITINIQVGYGEVGGSSLGAGALGESETFLSSNSYGQIRNALIADGTSAVDTSVVNHLPMSDPTGGHYWVATAEAKALGLAGASAAIDGYAGFSNTAAFDYDNSNGVGAGQYDFFGVVAHEFSEIMGRQILTGDTIGTTPNGYEPLDLLHYSAPGVHTFVGNHAGYFSVDGGNTDLGDFNTNPGGDYGDWAASAGNDAALAFSNSGVVNPFSSNDLIELDALGYNRSIGGQVANVQPAGLGWQIGITEDLNSDGHDDILWLQPSTGAAKVTYLSNGTISSEASFTTPGQGWSLIAHGDYNHDGNIDLLWQNSSSGQAVEDLLSGAQITSTLQFGVMGPDWHVISSGDFNGDGTDDLLWRNATTGQGLEWFLDHGEATSWMYVGTMGLDWRVASTTDLNHDGTSDVLWQNTNSNDGVEWFFQNGFATSWQRFGTMGPGWDVVATSDFNGDGKSDLLWQNESTGRIVEWFLDDRGLAFDWRDVGTPGSAWKVAGLLDEHAASGPTILLQNSSAGITTEIASNVPLVASQLANHTASVATGQPQTPDGHPDLSSGLQNQHDGPVTYLHSFDVLV